MAKTPEHDRPRNSERIPVPSRDAMEVRSEKASQALHRKDLADNPVEQFRCWFDDAVLTEPSLPEAVALATASPDGVPSARMLLCKGFDDEGFVFYTNYESAKAQELESNPQAALLFHWKSLERQVRIVGTVERMDRASTEAYFQQRPRESQLSAWASPQSQPVPDDDTLAQQRAAMEQRWADHESLPSPPHWGGYRVIPRSFEFWQGRSNRYHDRFEYQRQDDPAAPWRIVRLAP